MRHRLSVASPIVTSILVVLLASSACGGTPADGQGTEVEISPETFLPRADGTLVLVAGGYGYEPGDIVTIDIGDAPTPGDIVQYDDSLNGTGEFAFGPGKYLARLIAGPGDTAAFNECQVEANGFVAEMDCSDLQSVSWGDEWYEYVVGLSMVVPDGEFLADRWVGPTQDGNRLTVRQDAIIAVIEERVGHDEKIATYLRDMVY